MNQAFLLMSHIDKHDEHLQMKRNHFCDILICSTSSKLGLYISETNPLCSIALETGKHIYRAE